MAPLPMEPAGEALELRLSARMSRIDWGLAAVVGTDLAELHSLYEAAGGRMQDVVLYPDSLVRVHEDRVVVEVIAAGDRSRTIEDLGAVEMDISGVSHSIIGGRLPIESIDDVAALDSVAYVRVPAFVTNVGSVDSQGDAAQQSDELRSIFGLDGTGITVGVISDSYDTWADASDRAADNVLSGDLPAGVTVLQDYAIAPNAPSGDEGRAMLQIVHDVAPGANLAFHTGAAGPSVFEEAIRDLADPGQGGADVIVSQRSIGNTNHFPTFRARRWKDENETFGHGRRHPGAVLDASARGGGGDPPDHSFDRITTRQFPQF